jgi:hypothetical protein
MNYRINQLCDIEGSLENELILTCSHETSPNYWFWNAPPALLLQHPEPRNIVPRGQKWIRPDFGNTNTTAPLAGESCLRVCLCNITRLGERKGPRFHVYVEQTSSRSIREVLRRPCKAFYGQAQPTMSHSTVRWRQYLRDVSHHRYCLGMTLSNPRGHVCTAARKIKISPVFNLCEQRARCQLRPSPKELSVLRARSLRRHERSPCAHPRP